MNKIKKIKKGFTLIEMLISVFIFSIIMTATVVVFAGYVKSHKYSRIVQKNLEGVQFAFNYIAKTLRVSSVINGDGDNKNLFTYTEAGETCTYFYINNGALWRKSLKLADVPASVSAGNKKGDKCGKILAYTLTKGEKLTVGKIKDGKFYYTYTSRGDDTMIPPTVGRVTISVGIEDQTVPEGLIWAQTSVSLLNYPGELTF